MSSGPRIWHLPDIELASPSLVAGWREGQTPGGLAFRAPVLTEEGAGLVAAGVRKAALEARRARSLADVLRAASVAAERLADASTRAGAEASALLQDELGWPAELASETLAGMRAVWTEDALWSVVRAELVDPSVLDGFEEEASSDALAPGARSRRRRALGAPLLFQVTAGNVPGVAVTGVLRGLLVRSGVLVKVPAGEPGLVALFARALSDVDELFGRGIACTWWPGTEPGAEWNAWTAAAGKVVVYGDDETVASVRGGVPAHADIVAYGPRLGLAVVLPGADLAGAAAGLARDVCAYEQQGCVSPRLTFVTGSTGEFAELLAAALRAEVERIPRPVPAALEAVAIRAARAQVEFRSYATAGGRMLGSGDDLSWTILVDEPPVIDVEVLPRVVRVAEIARPEDLEELLRPLQGRIQVIGYAGDGGKLTRLAEIAASLGVSRLAPLGRTAWPPADWRHDGRFQLLPLLSWTDWER